MDIESLRSFGEAALSIFAIVNPIGGLPTFIGLTEDATAQERRRVFRLAGLTAFVMICVMALFGRFLLQYVFQINIDQFAFAGGLLLVVIGIRGVLSAPEHRKHLPADENERQMDQIRLAVTPIASPLLVGPGSIVNVMLIDSQRGQLFALAACMAAFVGVILILNYAPVLYRLMGRIGSLAVSRVMQIFIVAIGVKFCFVALAKVFPALVKAAQ
jgi:multiple antibiotic resistance protein